MQRSSIRSFTLVELLIVIAILAILAAAVIIVINPTEMIAEARDGQRNINLTSLNDSLKLFDLDNPGSPHGSANTVYISIPDTSSTCANITSLPLLPTGWSYNCVPAASLKNINGTGWLPVNFSLIKGGSPISSLPIDPKNDVTFFYSYVPGSWEIDAVAESIKGYSSASSDGGDDGYLLEKGSKLNITPLVDRDIPLRTVDPASIKVAIVDYKDCGQNVVNQLSRTGFTDVVDISTVTSWLEVVPYNPDVVIASQGCWGVSKPTLLNDLYDHGYAIYSEGNDTTTSIRPIYADTAVTSGTAAGTIIKEGIHPVHEGWTSTGNSGSDNRRGITAVRSGGVVIAKDETLGYFEIIYLQEPEKGKWMHFQPTAAPNDILFKNALMYLAR